VNTYPFTEPPGSENTFRYLDRGSINLALPELEHFPTIPLKGSGLPLVPGTISPKFLCPKIAIVFRQFELAMGASMPETAMNENCDFATRKSDVRTAWNTFGMKAIPS
jgi:hypothetical protein